MHTVIRTIAVFVTAVSAACAADAVKPAPELADLPARWKDLMAELQVPGMAVAVVRGDEVLLLEGLGQRDVQRQAPVTPDTYFYIASCTKSYLAMGILQLVEAGKVDLDAPVKKYLPRFELPDKTYTETITIRDLLSHAKGINSTPIVVLDAYTGEITEDRYYHFLKEATIEGSFDYTNVHYTLLGRVIEAITGEAWRDYLDKHLFDPAGMTRTTGYASVMYGDENAALPYSLEDGKFVPASPIKTDRTMHAAGGMGTTAHDLARWLRLNLSGGVIDGKRLLSEEHVTAMQTLHAGAGEDRGPLPHLVREGYGFGWTIGKFQNERHVQHGGGYTGTAANISMLPAHKLGVAVVANIDSRGHALAELVLADVYEKLAAVPETDCLTKVRSYVRRLHKQAKAEEPETRPNPAKGDGLSRSVDAYVGTYENDLLGTVRIERTGDKLTGHLGDLPFELFSTGKDRFDAVAATGSSSPGRFEMSDDGRVDAAIIGFAPGDADVRFERQGDK